MLNEINQTQELKYHMFALICKEQTKREIIEIEK